MNTSLQISHQPSAVLLAAHERAKQIRRQDDRLKREIEWVVQLAKVSPERARQYVLRNRGLLRF